MDKEQFTNALLLLGAEHPMDIPQKYKLGEIFLWVYTYSKHVDIYTEDLILNTHDLSYTEAYKWLWENTDKIQ